MQNLENLDVFETLISDYTKSAKMPEGLFCQIRPLVLIHSIKQRNTTGTRQFTDTFFVDSLLTGLKTVNQHF